MMPFAVLGGGTSVLIADLPWKALRQQTVQPALGRSEPFYSRHPAPAPLERSLVLDVLQIQRSVREVQTRPHRGIVA